MFSMTSISNDILVVIFLSASVTGSVVCTGKLYAVCNFFVAGF